MVTNMGFVPFFAANRSHLEWKICKMPTGTKSIDKIMIINSMEFFFLLGDVFE
jgi:hypothetical protein